ncbi:MAG: hypothetical protein PG977_000182 [Bartonella clarridgeiae]|uniref:BID domain-containing T4SS effector n=1 Tax=Bartonella clarridgeiae TaxID=56426 RepID=UPI0023F1F70E|nr:BID domain-containing T4SS effector [Bartonella clarridgeiae]WCR54789.1 MAG: hypothetical protein PG977_000182 [Bartonella clarridgeiae]
MKESKRVSITVTLQQPDLFSPYNYVYPNSNVLKNKYGITDFKSLESRCAHDSAKAVVNLMKEPCPERFDSTYLKYLHKRLFENTFEWAGHTRDVPFAFSDGTSAVVLKMKKSNSNMYFAVGKKIQQNLAKIDRILVEKNNLQGLSREEFVYHAAELFASINYTHPFREGNGRTQRMFFLKLAEAAGHTLDFSVVTTKRMEYVSVKAMQDRNLEPMQHMFEDISNPEKRRILKQFMSDMNEVDLLKLGCQIVMVPKEDVTYTGYCKSFGSDFITIEMQDVCIVCNKDYFTPEQLRALKLDDKLTFTIAKTANLENIFIPEEKIATLTEDEIIEKIVKHVSVQAQREKIKHYSKLVYGDSKRLEETIDMINAEPSFAKMFAKQIIDSSESIIKFSNIGISIEDPAYNQNKHRGSGIQKVEENLYKLGNAIEDYGNVVEASKNAILKEHQEKQKRCEQAVKMPSQVVQRILNLPENMWQEALKSVALLSFNKDLCNFMAKVNSRLSPCECKALNDDNYEHFAQSIGTSVSKAKTVIRTIKKIKEMQRQLQVARMKRLNAMNMTC